ncbi:MAG: flagellar basal body L-ring protein FlgH [Phycisphaerae bacterium]|nr:flagellar basal body L-ring protein FlgH [Phycisphaerae bacterium]
MRRNNNIGRLLIFSVATLAAAGAARGQSSSLFLEGEQVAAEQVAASQPSASAALPASAGAATPVDAQANDPLNQTSFTAVAPPEQRQFRVHDLVTIIVLERTRYKSDNRYQQDRRWDLQWKLEEWFRFHDRKWVQQPFRGGVPEIDMETNDRRTGNGQANRQDELTTRITARVVDVKPNGQLVLMASKTIEYDEEEQTMTLIGYCRGQDVTADNSILSTQLADVELRTKNSGQVRDASRRGWLQRITDTLRPF